MPAIHRTSILKVNSLYLQMVGANDNKLIGILARRRCVGKRQESSGYDTDDWD